ncbi:hypothetical protein AYI68_g520 [Smittium mucronatum]|uniref:Uncharacterized protein n=1 Tax=Smittium mucronatum TaxID=133383 RepID=A0A1R0H857_9FUNG|nr:hypothetical protein AYI68_g520 [Smittium mucronatum]
MLSLPSQQSQQTGLLVIPSALCSGFLCSKNILFLALRLGFPRKCCQRQFASMTIAACVKNTSHWLVVRMDDDII